MTPEQIASAGVAGLTFFVTGLLLGVWHLKRDCDPLISELRRQIADKTAEADWLRGGWSRTANSIHETTAAVRSGRRET